jgi:hypothetical protein
MELLLNLIWIVLATGSFLILMWRQRQSGRQESISWRSLITLACMLLLLFPIISASDDLHPGQTILEEASRRVQHFSSPSHISTGGPANDMLPALLLLELMLALITLQPCASLKSRVCLPDGHRRLREGRAPPFCS